MSTRSNDGDDALRASFKIQFPVEGPFVGPGTPTPDSMAHAGWDQNQSLPAYNVGGTHSVPFTPTLQFPPPGYSGDFYVDEFTDAKLREMWRAAQLDPALRSRVEASFAILQIPHQYRTTGTVDRRGLIDPHGEVDLGDIRRPSFFGAHPWAEAIAELDHRTTIVEVTVPREVLERTRLSLGGTIKLRGWHIQGDGIVDDAGRRHHALMVMVSGRTVETTALSHPSDPIRRRDDATGAWVSLPYPSASTEAWAARRWREYILEMVRAGFDVLTLDKRGHGISGGVNDSNMGEQANDIFRALDQLESGEGLRLRLADGTVLAGDGAAGRLLRGATARTVPVVLCGPSQGAMVSAWAMTKNFVEDISYDMPGTPSAPARGYAIKGAILLAPFSAGVGYRSRIQAIAEGANRVEFNVQAFPSSEILRGVHRWPAVFVGRGLWDFAESLEGSFEFFRRARGLKEIAVVRGPHGEGEWGRENFKYMVTRMAAFGRAVVLGLPEIPGARTPADLKELVASSPPYWEETSAPADAKASRQGGAVEKHM